MDQITPTAATLARDANSKPTSDADIQAMHQMLVPFSVAYLVGAFVTDPAHWQTAGVMWERFSIWLITASVITATFVAIAP
ncbi:hypothetical protein SAMN05444161_8443 [Rhizobiales bacterium GAS191]|nr:hypothetical protein SAMN05444161_8443 [Rhizobiales bacterium GAS191]